MLTYFIFQVNRNDELQSPFYEKQLEAYIDAAGVAARISVKMPSIDKDDEEKFWSLYWGILPIVESPPFARRMTAFCKAIFPVGNKCSRLPTEKVGRTAEENLAIDIANQVKDDVQRRWGQSHATITADPAPVAH